MRVPSAIVRDTSSAGQRTISPRASESRASAASSGSTPMTRASGRERLDRRRDAAGQPAAADRDEDRGDVRQVLDDLEPDGALAGDDPVVVERRDDREPALARRARSATCWRSSLAVPTIDDLGAVGRRRARA